MPKGAPSGKNKKNWKEPSRAFGLRSANVGGIEVRGGPGTVRGGPGTARRGPDTVRGRPIIMQIPDSDSLLDCHLRLID